MNKRQAQIAKIQKKIATRLGQKNTDKKSKDISKWEARIKKLETNQSLGTKGKLSQELKKIDDKIATAGMWYSPTGPARDYWEKKKEEKLTELRKIEAEQKKDQRLKKLLAEGFLPGQKKPGVKSFLSPIEKKRRHNHRRYYEKLHAREETRLKGLFQEIFGKKEGKEKWLITKERREKYKGKSGWFGKWVKKTEKRLIRGGKSLQKSQDKKDLKELSKLAGEKVKKKPSYLGWNRWVESEKKRLGKIAENKKKTMREIEEQIIICKGEEKAKANTWSIYDRANKKKDKGQWYWGLYRVINDYTGDIGVWEANYKYVLDFNKIPVSGLVIDYDSETVWTERLW